MPYIQIKKNTDLKGLLISRGKGKCMLIKTAIARTVIRPSANHRRELDYPGKVLRKASRCCSPGMVRRSLKRARRIKSPSRGRSNSRPR